MGDDSQEPKLIIDTDWKSQAQAEKEKLSEQVDGPGKDGGKKLPPPAFLDIVRTLIEPALLYMGQFPDPATGRAVVSLEAAKYYIDLLGILEAKTKGNLAADEADTLRRATADLRAEFVEVSKAVAQAIAQGKISPRSVGGSPAGPGPASGLVTP